MGAVIPKLRQSARGQLCMFQIPGICNHDRETTVLCHIRDEEKGLGNKSNDWSAAFGCSACHQAIDEHWLSAGSEHFYSLRAMQRTHKVWFDSGIMLFSGDRDKKPKPSAKIMPRRPLALTRNT